VHFRTKIAVQEWQLTKATHGEGNEIKETGKLEDDGAVGAEIEKIKCLWFAIVSADSEEIFETRWATFQNSDAPPALIQYIDKQWIKHRHRFVACWADRYLHLG
jgi:hypothetical protein